MKLIHNNSQQCMHSGLDVFSLPPTQTAINSSQWVEYNPVSTIAHSSPIEFIVSGSGEEYMDLANTLLEVKACIKAIDGTTVISDTTHVAPVNNTLHSLFSQLDVTLNDVTVSSASNLYPYRAYISTHLNFGYDAKTSKLESAMYFIDDNLTSADPIDGDNRNTGLVRRHQLCTASKTFDMVGQLHGDVFFQNRYMMNGVTMKIRLSRTKDAFSIMGVTGAPDCRIEIISAKLFIRKLKITPSLALAHEKILQTKPALYPITRVECKIIHLPSGQKNFAHENVFWGLLPNRIILGIVDNKAFNGDIKLNPFEFKNCGLNYLAVHVGGEQIPWAPLRPSFATNNYIRAYYTQFTGGDGIGTDTGHGISRDDFKNGHSLYCFDLTPDLSSSSALHLTPSRSGNLRIEVGFQETLPFTGNIIIYSEFQNIIEVDSNRKVSHNYGN